MKKRTQSREYAIQMMYQAEILDSDPVTVTELFWKSVDMPAEEVADFAEQLFTYAFSRKAEHDRTIAMFLKDGWPFDRLGEIEKSILRVAIDELLHSSTPAYAVMDDYVTLTKRFTDEKSTAFVNGLLESIRNTFIKPTEEENNG